MEGKKAGANNLSSSNSVILAAGGLLWRWHKGVREIAVVYRNRYKDWTLPKGKLQPADPDLQATAQREVKEETGFASEITGFAGCICYEHEGKPKVVLFWEMMAKGKSSFQESEEVGKYEWLPVAQAMHRLDYPKERDLLRRYADE